jgi:tRNA modification GTPase
MTSDSRLPTTDAPRCAVFTPAGRGAIATVAVRGAGAIAAVSRCFQPAANRPLASFAIGRAVFGRFRTSAVATEELVVGLIAADEVEIHCHGGRAAVAAVCERLIAEGCRLVSANEWVQKCESDPLSAKALLALGAARTERTAAILLDQYRGALRRELTAIEHSIARQDIGAAAAAVRQLLARTELGLHLTQPWRVVIAGRPNAGKSSLINALLGYQRSIVWHEPGTTRDVLTAATAIDGWPIELADTAGLRASAEAIEAEGVARAQRQISAADLVILVADVTATWDEGLLRSLAGRPVIVVHNKCDLASPPVDGRPAGLDVSAQSGLGIDALCAAVAQTLVPDPPPRGAALPFTAPQISALAEAAVHLKRGDIAAARRALAFGLQ